MSSGAAALPKVSVVIPMLDEAAFIEACLDGFARQTYPHALMDVIVVDGGSRDGSRDLVDTRVADSGWLRVLDNPDRRASSAFNRGIEAARGEVVCLFSAHGVPAPSYLESSVATLSETHASGVGGSYLHQGLDPVSNAIGLAMASPFGMASPQRFARERQDIDTISHPAYLRTALIDVGLFDESLERNSDYELNSRLRRGGHRLVFDPAITSAYRPRGSLGALARQFWWYGRWKAKVVRRDPGSVRVRHLAAPVAVAAGTLVPLSIPFSAVRRAVSWAILSYALLIGLATLEARPWEHEASPIVFGAALPVMHTAWGGGFLMTVLQAVAGR